jgi:polysaccharide export outer membrane protein
MDDIENGTLIKNIIPTIQKNDELKIFISAENMDVVRPFNQNYYVAQSLSPNTTPTDTGGKSYIVDSEGNIDFPVIGKINVENKTIEGLRDEITKDVSKYVKNPSVTIRIVNFKVTVLGEVNKPGQYIIPEGQTTILNAISLAGDLTMYGERDGVLFIRNENGQIYKDKINLKDANFVNSPYFQLKQGDIIYVLPNKTKEKTAQLNPNTGIYIAVAGTIIGLIGLFVTILKN